MDSVKSKEIWNGEEITNGESLDSEIFEINSEGIDEGASLHIKTTGGTVKIEAYAGNCPADQKTDFVVPNGASDVVTAQTAGNALYKIDFGMFVTRFFLRVTASVNDVVITAWMGSK